MNFKDSKNPFHTLIHEKGLRIHSAHFNMDLDMMLVILNNKKVIQRNIDTNMLQNIKIN